MKTSYIIVGGVVVVVIISGIVWYMGQGSTPSSTPPTGTPTSPMQQVPAPAVIPTSSQPVSVTISNFAFNPSQVSVKVGTKITWTNKDSAPHTVTSNDGSFDSGTLKSGGTYSFVFNAPGTFSYRCTFHPSMKATVVVTQ